MSKGKGGKPGMWDRVQRNTLFKLAFVVVLIPCIFLLFELVMFEAGEHGISYGIRVFFTEERGYTDLNAFLWIGLGLTAILLLIDFLLSITAKDTKDNRIDDRYAKLAMLATLFYVAIYNVLIVIFYFL